MALPSFALPTIVGALLALTITAPIAYGVGYWRASFKNAQQLQLCQTRLTGFIEAEAQRVQTSSDALKTRIISFGEIQKSIQAGVNKSLKQDKETASKLERFQNALEKIEIPKCTAVGVGGELRKLATD